MEIFRRPEGSINTEYEVAAQRLARHRVLTLRGPIYGAPQRWDAYGPTAIYETLLALSVEDPTAPIYLFIESPGGDVETGFHLFDLIRMLPNKVVTIGQSCASMASVLLAAGDERWVFPSARVMLHLPRMMSAGDQRDIEIHSREMKKIRDAIVSAYVACGAKRTAAQVLKDMDRDYWMTAQETIEYGLADRVVDAEMLRTFVQEVAATSSAPKSTV